MAFLEIKHLSVAFNTRSGTVYALRDVSLSLERGETLVLVGESGCGKSVLCRTLLGLLPDNAVVTGEICFEGVPLSAEARRRRCSAVFQDPTRALNPVMKIGAQVQEGLKARFPALTKTEAAEKTRALLEAVQYDAVRIGAYPHECSGGMCQRAVIAAALACEPELLIADEPTTALDALTQARVVESFNAFKRRGGACLFVTHDLGDVASAADSVAVMYAGEIVERAPAQAFFENAHHPYTISLLKAQPSPEKKHLMGLPGHAPRLTALPKGDAFAPRNPWALEIDYKQAPPWFKAGKKHWVKSWLMHPEAPRIDFGTGSAQPGGDVKTGQSAQVRESECSQAPVLAALEHVSVRYGGVQALKDVSLEVHAGEIFGLAGASGSGKSTTARVLMGLTAVNSGRVWYDGTELSERRARRRPLAAERRLIFQNPGAAFNARRSVRWNLEEPLRLSGVVRTEWAGRIEQAVQEVGLPSSVLTERPRSLSGGMAARAAVAQALITRPKLIIADECTASLDVSARAQILNLFKALQQRYGFSLVFISHDLALLTWLCGRAAVLRGGTVVETGAAAELFTVPKHPYTRALVQAVPKVRAAL